VTERYVWTRQEGETPPAYKAFSTYLHMPDRSLARTAEELGKSLMWMKELSAKNDWAARTLAFDQYMADAKTDGMVHQISEARDKNLALMDKLRGLLDSRLDDFIAKRDDPTIRWTQACMAMAKIEANSLLMGKEDKTDSRIERIEELVERAMKEPVTP
jgi:hypothetical protein